MLIPIDLDLKMKNKSFQQFIENVINLQFIVK